MNGRTERKTFSNWFLSGLIMVSLWKHSGFIVYIQSGFHTHTIVDRHSWMDLAGILSAFWCVCIRCKQHSTYVPSCSSVRRPKGKCTSVALLYVQEQWLCNTTIRTVSTYTYSLCYYLINSYFHSFRHTPIAAHRCTKVHYVQIRNDCVICVNNLSTNSDGFVYAYHSRNKSF